MIFFEISQEIFSYQVKMYVNKYKSSETFCRKNCNEQEQGDNDQMIIPNKEYFFYHFL